MQQCSPLDADDRNKMPDDRQKKSNVLYKSGIHGQADLRTLCHHSTEYTHPGNQVYTRYGSYPSSRLCSQENTPRTHRLADEQSRNELPGRLPFLFWQHYQWSTPEPAALPLSWMR